MNNYQPLVSVIIPVYNQAHYLQRALNCVFSQTHPNIEVIVVDDGSTDNPELVTGKYQRKGLIIRHEYNRGVAAAMNTGLRFSLGEYMQRYEADDLMEPTKIEECVDAIMETGAAVAYTDFSYQYDGHKQNCTAPDSITFESLISSPSAQFPTHSPLVEMELARRIGFDTDLPSNNDFMFYVHLAARGVMWVRVPKNLCTYSADTPGSFSKKRLLMTKCRLLAYKKIKKLYGDRLNPNEINAIIKGRYLMYAIDLWKARKYVSAMAALGMVGVYKLKQE